MALTQSEIFSKSAEITSMLQKGIDPLKENELLKQENIRMREELSKLKNSETFDLENKLLKCEEGKALVSARDKKIKELVIELLSNNPLTSHRTETIISNFKEEAQRILDDKTKDNWESWSFRE